MGVDQSKYAKQLFLFFLTFFILEAVESIIIILYGNGVDVVSCASVLIFIGAEALQQYFLLKERPISILKVGLDLAQMLALVILAAKYAVNHNSMAFLFFFGVAGWMLRLHYDLKALEARKN